MPTRTCARFIAVAFIAVFTPPALATEKWSDPNLPVKDGLELWLDAARLPAAAEANGVSPPRAGGAVATWYDGSGKRRDAAQDAPARRPTFRTDLVKGQPVPVVAFDGRDDGLLASVAGLELRDFTIFLVASPLSNAGTFRGLLSLNQRGQNDYTTGLNVDLGGAGSGSWSRVNIEGRGFGGERNLLNGVEFPFGTFHALALTSVAEKGEVTLAVDGKPQGKRPRTKESLKPDELRAGFRFANPNPQGQGEIGFLDGCVAEVIVYSRALSGDERASVEQYLRQKHAPLFALAGVPQPPPVRILVPGFAVRELPIKLTNLTNIRYGPDNRLYATGYDGRLHAMADTDGDGVEDKSEVIWDEPTFRTPMAFGWAPGNDRDLYVVSNGKVSVLRDEDRDGRPDKEEIFNTGWPPDAGFTGGGVDAVGLAFDRDGNLYIGLGCTLFANPYLVDDKTGVSRYDVRSERGTILKISPDGKKREIVCTGIRFPIGLSFNRHGDLFCTDQEGATWLEGGNPLDELNHIRPGLHYGFPFRHEKYLPNVTDEPPAATFGPQHQSTCGLIFNGSGRPRGTGSLPVKGSDTGKLPVPQVFGPDFWADNAIVAGFSRGKLWRVPLAKAGDTYVGGRPHLFAALRLLTLDTAVDPRGNLTVACHGGEPDWGTGPGGEGRLFKIVYEDRDVAQPVLAWAAGPMEVRVAFDRPVEPALLSEALREPSKITITYGEFVRAGDKYEVLKPPYAVVEQQSRAFRGELRVTGARLSEDRRTLVLTTDPHPMQAWYAVSIPFGAKGAAVELDYDLTGVEAAWVPAEADALPSWTGWLPHPDLDVCRVLAGGSAEHERLFELARGGAGRLVVAPSREEASPHVAYRAGRRTVRFPAWVPRQLPAPPPPAKDDARLAGGDWRRGEALFFSAEANCFTCHVVRGKGGKIGPDLSNLVHRDAAGIYRDITEPNAVINPDHRGYTVVTRDKRVLAGLVRSDSADRLRIYDTAGKETVVARSEVDQLRADAISIMPEGFARLGPEKLRDLVVFLIFAEPPAKELLTDFKPRQSSGNTEPPPRTRAEVEAVLGKQPGKVDPQKLRSLRVLLVAGPKDHGPLEHDYPQWQKDWEPLLTKAPRLKVATAFGKPTAQQWESADLAVFFCWGPQFWDDDETHARLDKFFARGGGLAVLHSGVIAEKEPEKLAGRIGLSYRTLIKFRHGPLDLKLTDAGRQHPATRGFPASLHFVDESYWPHVGDAARAAVLMTQDEEGQGRPMVWAVERGKGRAFSTILGHYSWTFDDPLARALMLRGMAWAAGEDDVRRFDALALDGVRLREEGEGGSSK